MLDDIRWLIWCASFFSAMVGDCDRGEELLPCEEATTVRLDSTYRFTRTTGWVPCGGLG